MAAGGVVQNKKKSNHQHGLTITMILLASVDATNQAWIAW